MASWYRIGHRYGTPDAPVKIVQFGSHGCGFCRDFHFAIDSLRTTFPDQVGLTWIHAVGDGGKLDGPANLSAVASECAARQGRFESYHDAVFRSKSLPGSARDLTRLARGIGVPDTISFEACLDTRETEAAVTQHLELAEAADLPGTPVWYLNGRRYVGAATYAELLGLVTSTLR